MRYSRAIFAAAISVLLSACTTTRPQEACRAPSIRSAIDSGASSTLALPQNRKTALNILVLSGGGFWGAYGAGFLNGWSARDTKLGNARPEFDLVTGVSTGAIIAPFALLGKDGDGILRDAYQGVSAVDLLGKPSLLRVLKRNALSDTTALREKLNSALSDSILQGLANASHEGRSAWVGMTNFDDGAFARFNISAIAATKDPRDARVQIADRIIASASFPVLLPPQFIDGCMYFDGSVRENLFLAEMESTIAAMVRRHGLSSEGKVRIFVILNGPTKAVKRRTENNFLAVASRSVELAIDQNQLSSLRQSYYFARRHGFEFYWTSADAAVGIEGHDGPCGPLPNPLDGIASAFTRCLFGLGEKAGRDSQTPLDRDILENPAAGTGIGRLENEFKNGSSQRSSRASRFPVDHAGQYPQQDSLNVGAAGSTSLTRSD